LHSEIDVDVFELLAVNFGHDLQSKDLVSSAYAKLPHSRHDVAAEVEEKLPLGQSTHLCSPGSGLYVPGKHFEHKAPLGAKYPLGHGVHSVDPDLDSVPGGQFSQELESAIFVLKVPGGHGKHWRRDEL
jgi:hypothetical protein